MSVESMTRVSEPGAEAGICFEPVIKIMGSSSESEMSIISGGVVRAMS